LQRAFRHDGGISIEFVDGHPRNNVYFGLNLPVGLNPAGPFSCFSTYEIAMSNRYKVLAFGITRQLLGGKEAVIEVEGNTVGALRKALSAQFPELRELNSLYIAVNSNYSDEGQILDASDEIALIPPVSGG